MTIASLPQKTASLKVAVLHDETDSLKEAVGAEAHVGVWEAILPVEESLKRLGHRPIRASLGKSVTDFIENIKRNKPDVVFHLAETAYGDTLGESRMTSLLDLLQIPHTSVSPDSLVLCRDKLAAKVILRERGVLTPPYAVSFDGRLPDALPLPPWISKPTLEDGSIGVTSDAVTSDPAALKRRVRRLHKIHRQPILIESYIAGREINVGVVGREVLPLVEFDFSKWPAGESPVVNFESKWQYDTKYFRGAKMICPAPVNADVRSRIIRTALRALESLNVRGYSRVDMRIDTHGKIYVLEINPNPDLSPIAGMAIMADTAGWKFDGLIRRILDFALEKNSHTQTHTDIHK